MKETQMNKPHFVVISGRKQVGKSTTAKIIKDVLNKEGIPTVETSFAEPLKRFANDVFGIPLSDMETEEGKQKPSPLLWSDLYRPALVQDDYDRKTGYMTNREVLQYLGSNILRNRFYNDIWASAPFKREYNELIGMNCSGGHYYDTLCSEDVCGGGLRTPEVVIISDCRFKNELKYAEENNATTIRIERNSIAQDNHISERDLDDINTTRWTSILVNQGTLEELEFWIKSSIIPKIKERL